MIRVLFSIGLLALNACGSEPESADIDQTDTPEHLFETQEKALRSAEQLEQSLQESAEKRLESVDEG